MARNILFLALFCATVSHVYGSRSLTQSEVLPPTDDGQTLEIVPALSPDYAPAPTTLINGVEGYTCPSPGITGYLFQPDPCRFGDYEGEDTYCDLSTEGVGYIGIRDLSEVECVTTNSCPTGHFCSEQTDYNRTCTPVADVLCFAGALPPSPGPALGEDDDSALEEVIAGEPPADSAAIAPALTGN